MRISLAQARVVRVAKKKAKYVLIMVVNPQIPSPSYDHCYNINNHRRCFHRRNNKQHRCAHRRTVHTSPKPNT
jgi:hypothetical protein